MEAPPNRKSKTLRELLIASPLPSLIGSLPDPIGTQCIVREGKSHPGPSYGCDSKRCRVGSVWIDLAGGLG